MIHRLYFGYVHIFYTHMHIQHTYRQTDRYTHTHTHTHTHTELASFPKILDFFQLQIFLFTLKQFYLSKISKNVIIL